MKFLDKKVSDPGVTCNFRFRLPCCNVHLPLAVSRRFHLFHHASVISKFGRYELTKTYAMGIISILLIKITLLISICYKKYIQKRILIGVLIEDLLLLLVKILYINKQFFSDTAGTTEISSSFQIIQLLQREVDPFR